MDSIEPSKTPKHMTFGRFALITVAASIVIALVVECLLKREPFDLYAAGVVTSYVIFAGGGTLITVALLLLVRRTLRGTSSWPYWCGSVVFLLASLVLAVASMSTVAQSERAAATSGAFVSPDDR